MDSKINLQKYRDYLNKTDDLLDDNIPCDSTNFEGNWISHSYERTTQMKLKLNNDLLSETSSAEANFKFRREKSYQIELIAKSDGSRTAKFSTEKIPQVKKVKLASTYNPWIDVFNVNCQAEYKHKKFLSSVVAHYGRKTGLEAIATINIFQKLVLGLNGFYDLKKNTLSTYNFIVALGFLRSKVVLEHQSLPGEKMAFGNWVLRGFFKPNSCFKFGARAFFDSESKDATIEMGGKYRAGQNLALYWKFVQDGTGFLGLKSQLARPTSSSAYVGRLGYSFNFAKRNIFEDPGKFGFSVVIKGDQRFFD